MRKLMTLALLAASALPAVAQAQSQRELRDDRQDIREQQRDLNRAYRHGDRGDVRDARGDLRDARQEYREDLNDRNRRWARNDWMAWRDRNAGLYARGTWNAPFRYYAFRPGARIQPLYYGPRFVIADPWRYHLPPAYGAQRWVRHYNDVLLIDYRRGIVVDVIRNFYR